MVARGTKLVRFSTYSPSIAASDLAEQYKKLRSRARVQLNDLLAISGVVARHDVATTPSPPAASASGDAGQSSSSRASIASGVSSSSSSAGSKAGSGGPGGKVLKKFADRYAFVDFGSVADAAAAAAAGAKSSYALLFSWHISLVNHACSPNATLKRAGGDAEGEEWLVVAERDIAAGEEVTVSYAYARRDGRGGNFTCLCDSCVGTNSERGSCSIA